MPSAPPESVGAGQTGACPPQNQIERGVSFLLAQSLAGRREGLPARLTVGGGGGDVGCGRAMRHCPRGAAQSHRAFQLFGQVNHNFELLLQLFPSNRVDLRRSGRTKMLFEGQHFLYPSSVRAFSLGLVQILRVGILLQFS